MVQRRKILAFAGVSAGALGSLALTACGGGGGDSPAAAPAAPVVVPPPSAVQLNRYTQANLVANKPSYQATFIEPDFVDAWGIAIRPAGAGGHFWIGGGGTSWQYLGDVKNSATPGLRALSQDGLKKVTVEGADSKVDDSSAGKITGVVFNGADINSTALRVEGQTAGATRFSGSARFLFVTDSGKVSAWTERTTTGAIVRTDGAAQLMYDGSADGSAFFGVAIKPDTWDTVWLADFGAQPGIVTLDRAWNKVPTVGFVNPFATGVGGAARPGDPVPFNIQVLKNRVFVLYAISQPDPSTPGSFFAAEEDALDAAAEQASGNRPNKGKLVEFDLLGNRVRIYDDGLRLNAPWGVELAPANFGKLSGTLLVGNFGGAGRISAFDQTTGRYVDDLRDATDKPVGIAGLWALQFGNGESLGDSTALYFAAGPEDEVDGLFGSLRYTPN